MSIRDDINKKCEFLLSTSSQIVDTENDKKHRVNSYATIRTYYKLNGKTISDKKNKEIQSRIQPALTDDEMREVFDIVDASVKAVIEGEKKDREIKQNALPNFLSYDEKGILKVDMIKYSDFIQKSLNVVYYSEANQLYVYSKEDKFYRPEKIGNEIDVMIRKLFEDNNLDSSHLRYYSDELRKHLKSMFIHESYPFNNSNDTLPVQNGVLQFDYENGNVTLLPHGPEHLFDYIMGAGWDANATEDEAKNLMRQWVPEDTINVLIQIGAQSLVQKQLNVQLKRSTLIVGLPNTGKTKFKKLLTSTLGTPFISSVSLQDISDDPFVTGSLEKSVLNFKDDMDRVPIQSVSNFKDFTGDATQHMINRKMEPQYPGNINCGWAFTCNFPPSVTEKIKRDTAFWKRWNLAFFNHVFQDVDADFEKRVFTASLRSSFLKSIVNMMITIRRTGHLVVEQPVESVMTEWLSRCDSVSDFLETGLFVDVERGDDPICYIKESLFNIYQQVSVNAGFESENILQNKNAFYSTMQNHGFIPTRKECSEISDDGKTQRRTYECFKSWLRPAGNKMNDGHYHIKIGQINLVSNCLFENRSTDISNILTQPTTRVCG